LRWNAEIHEMQNRMRERERDYKNVSIIMLLGKKEI